MIKFKLTQICFNYFFKFIFHRCNYIASIRHKITSDVIKAKKQEEELRSALDDFYEEELNWWDREHEKGEEL